MELLKAIREAERREVALGHFNIASLEQLKAVAHVGMRLDVPVIVGVSEGEEHYLGAHRFRDLVAYYNAEHARAHGFRLFLNADHTHSLERVKEVARVGFHAVLFDGGRLPLEENINLTRQAVALAKGMNHDILMEGELGYLGGSSGVLGEVPEGAAVRPEDFTRPEDAARFVKETKVDLLSPAVGNVHGMLRDASNPRLDIPRIGAIREAAGVPLVLHGGSGVWDEDFVAAIDAGVAVVHISTELRVAWREGMERSLKEHPREVTPYKIMPEVIAAMEQVVERRLKLFNKVP